MISNEEKENENDEEIILTYKVNAKEISNNKIRILGDYFVENNKKNCYISYDNQKLDLNSFILMKSIKEQFNNNNELVFQIKLHGVNKIISSNSMFNKCSFLFSISNISNWDTSKILNMSYMFNECSSIIFLPDISKWNTSRVTDMSFMFSNCSSLLSLPDISKWNTSKVSNMGWMFSGCNSLSSMPDISNWNTSNVIGMSCIFSRCSSLTELPDISKWDTSNVKYMNGMFALCYSLSFLPNITKWNKKKLINKDSIFNRAINMVNCFKEFSSQPKNEDEIEE